MRLLLTRPMPEASRSAQKLLALGHEVSLLPLMQIEPLPVIWPSLPQALLASSAQAFMQTSPEDWHQLPIFCVGSQTAAAARQAGFTRIHTGTGSGAALAPMLEATRFTRIVYIAGQHRKPDLERALKLDVIETYTATELPTPPDFAEKLSSVEGVLHYSRRSAEIFLRKAKEASVDLSRLPVNHFCLSEDVAAPFEAQKLPVFIASAPNELSLFATLAA